MITASLRDLKHHPAQMRTVYDLDDMAHLTLQVHERDIDEWQPITAVANGSGYYIISGHRRRMARLFAYGLADHDELTFEQVQSYLTNLTQTHSTLEVASNHLLEQFGDEEIHFALFEGDEKAQILALQSANFGSEKPDMMGLALSFRLGLMAGTSPEELARNVGQSVRFIQNHLALTEIPKELSKRIVAGELPLSVASVVSNLPEPKRSGLAQFILANGTQLTAGAIKQCATALKKWQGLQVPLTVTHQTQRNIARVLTRLWSQVVEAYPEEAWAAATLLIYRDQHEEPWADQEKLSAWFRVLGGDAYYTENGIHWPNVVAYLLTEVSCEGCPLSQLPKETLRSDLSSGQGGVLGMPCRVGEEASRCLHGFAPSDPIHVRVPWDWADHDGVEHEGGTYVVKSLECLQNAWQLQAEAEKVSEITPTVIAEAVLAEEETDSVVTAVTPSPTSSTQPDPITQPPKPTPVMKQREQIAHFMEHHLDLSAEHPLSTPCHRCRHKLEGSPTKDEAVPHCAWAGRLRNVTFTAWEPVDGEQSAIPVCHQFAPTQRWTDLIPEHAEPPGMPRSWVKHMLLKLVAQVNGAIYNDRRRPFAFLTGRPMSSKESANNWFAQQLNEQIGDLTDGQLWTLFIWGLSEWELAQGESFLLPIDGNQVQFQAYQEKRWREVMR